MGVRCEGGRLRVEVRVEVGLTRSAPPFYTPLRIQTHTKACLPRGLRPHRRTAPAAAPPLPPPLPPTLKTRDAATFRC